MPDGRTFDLIARTPGNPWHTIPNRCFGASEVAALVLDPQRVVGIRHRHLCQVLSFDIDAHRPSPSPYWRPDGQSPELQRLEALSAEHGLGHCLMRSSSSGGLRVHLVLPVPVHPELAHHVGLLLAARAGLHIAPGRCELFPSSTRFTPGGDPKTWKRRHGLRLPGQAGSALWTGRGWADDPLLQWKELEALLEVTVPTPAWDALLQEARRSLRAARCQRPQLRGGIPRRPCATIRHRVAWTGPSQSNDNLGKLAIAAYLQTVSRHPEVLGPIIARLARDAPGFERWASADTKGRLEQWATAWARSCIASPPQRKSRDPGHNARRHRMAVCQVIAAAHRAAKEAGEEASSWSLRTIASFTGLHRQTVKKLLGIWQARVRAAVFAGRGRRLFVAGTHPLPSGGGSKPQACSLPTAVLFPVENRPLELVSTGPPAADRHQSLQPQESSTPLAWLAQKKSRERAELLAWITTTCCPLP
jgi:hypothetical protein